MNFISRLVKNLAPEVFKPLVSASPGILYLILQAITREISGECPWSTDNECLQGFNEGSLKPPYWLGSGCRNTACPVYRSPRGVVGYTSRSSTTSSIDNRFDYSAFRQKPNTEATYYDEFVDCGTLAAQVRWRYGEEGQEGGWGAWHFGDFWFGVNAWLGGAGELQIGDKFYMACYSSEVRNIDGSILWYMGQYDSPIADAANRGGYTPVIDDPVTGYGRWNQTSHKYRGDFNTTYTLEIIDHWGYVQNFNNAILQICLATATDTWLDYWGEYFGIIRLINTAGSETDDAYRARIIREITRAKGTKPVLLEESNAYFNSDRVTITEYMKTPIWRGVIPAGTPGMDADELIHPSRNFVTLGVKVGMIVFNETNLPTDTTLRYNATISAIGTTVTANDTLTLTPPMPTAGRFHIADAYRIVGNWDGIIDPSVYTDEDAKGLQPFQFYINTPAQRAPSAKFVKDGYTTTLTNPEGTQGFNEPGAQVWVEEGGTGYSSYGYGDFHHLTEVTSPTGIGVDMFIPPGSADDVILFGNTNKFTGINMKFVQQPRSWTQSGTTGFGDVNNSLIIAPMVVLNSKLHAMVSNTVTGIEVWAFNGTSWTQVNVDGFGDASNISSYGAYVNSGDGYLYVGTWNPTTGAEIWRTDGTGGPPYTWNQVNTDGFGDSLNQAADCFVSYGGSLYCGTYRTSSGAAVWRYDGGTTWTRVSSFGFGDSNNVDILSIENFRGELVASTWNTATGAEVWSSFGIGSGVFTDWHQINTNGFGSSSNYAVMGSCVKDSYLWVTVNSSNGAQVWKYSGSLWSKSNTDGFGYGSVGTNVFGPISYRDRVYVGITNATGVPVVEIWVLEDTTWKRCSGSPAITSAANGSSFGIYTDQLFIGVDNVINSMVASLDAIGGTYIWEYFSNGVWRTIQASDNLQLFTQDGYISWKLGIKDDSYKPWTPTGAVVHEVPDVGDGLTRYWVRCRILTPPTQIAKLDYAGIVFAGSTLRGHYCATGFIDQTLNGGISYLSLQDHTSGSVPASDVTQPGVGDQWRIYWIVGGNATIAWEKDTYYNSYYHRQLTDFDAVGKYNYAQRDKIKTDLTPAANHEYKNNIYVYEESEFAKPVYESGLQEIIDRLKTAGTIAIINPLD